MKNKLNITFIHPDLGIGGAERLVVDVALALKRSGHNIQILTPHHDTDHCFPETKDGTLDVKVVGNFFWRSIFGRCQAFCSYIRMVFAAFYLIWPPSKVMPDLVFCDQVSACIPLIKRRKTKVLFYCHFPDLLQTKRESWLKKMYRWPLDWVEEYTTGQADRVLVNSKFTEEVFYSTFKSLKEIKTTILYPSLDFTAFDRPLTIDRIENLHLKNVQVIFLSINRYERKKNLALALDSLAHLKTILPADKWTRVHLILAGGYDKLVPENIDHYLELQQKVNALQIEENVTFLRSPSDEEKRFLLHSCTCLIYTPSNEHFGIVPLESMFMRRPVIACNSGGPRETVVDQETGFLCEANAPAFAQAMNKFIQDKDRAREMGIKGRERVEEKFSFQSFSDKIENVVSEMMR